eukprot:TRINITY_DN4132_c0_g1_i3.p1 TRINITY_DN4132_c0_g1~~TRINITY_DN4132_c0_g1_i3.p1  ORF type:complete len:239 (-),score=46.32 TRINITY_DN4132_c0_g1_i3:121-837(-)
MASYLDDFLESISSLPSELRRSFSLMRELDYRTEELKGSLEKNTKHYLSSVRKNPKHSEDSSIKSLYKHIQEDQKTCTELADEKVLLAEQTYELVDKHIRRLDEDLRKFESELKKNEGPDTPALKKQKSTNGPAEVLSSPVQARATLKTRNERKSSGVPIADDAQIRVIDSDMPIDPNEPTYCICNRVSFGEMVGCDNNDCKVEWFHFECVGLVSKPKGKWYCPECTAMMRKRGIPTR